MKVPIELRLVEDGREIGTTRSDRILLPAGRHTLELVNDDLGFRTKRTVDIPAGRATSIDIPVPEGRVNFNAQPWAEVLVDGRRLGETPLGNVALPAGRHEILFRNPELGERRQTVLIRSGESTRVAVDFSRP